MTNYCQYCDCRSCRNQRASEKMRAWLLSRETQSDRDREAEQLARAVGNLSDELARASA